MNLHISFSVFHKYDDNDYSKMTIMWSWSFIWHAPSVCQAECSLRNRSHM